MIFSRIVAIIFGLAWSFYLLVMIAYQSQKTGKEEKDSYLIIPFWILVMVLSALSIVAIWKYGIDFVK